MSRPQTTTHEGIDNNEVVDQVLESYKHRQPAVKVEKVSRNAYEGRVEWLKVYGKREDQFKDLETGEVRTNSRFVKINDMPESVGYEVLIGLAEAYGYELSPK